MREKTKKAPKYIYYLMLIAVVITWGIDPVVNSYFYNYFSASALISLATFASTVVFFILSFKKLKNLNKDYLKIAVPISALNAIACMLQRIGLQYTTPANYAFLEQLSCVIVPIAVFLFVRRKPTVLQAVASIACIVGCFIFSGLGTGGLSFGVGELLCSAAGIILGVSIAATGLFVKKLDISLYMLIHMSVYFLVSAALAVSLNFIKSDGVPLEKFVFTFDMGIVIAVILFGLFSVGLCWLLRTEATRNINPTAVAIISPFSAVITGVVSVIFATDTLSKSFVIGALIITLSMVISTINDIIAERGNKTYEEVMKKGTGSHED